MNTQTRGWTKGQRVVNEAEPELGLGTIVRQVDHRTMEVSFAAAGTTRLYNVKTAPLRRVVLQPGQQVTGRDGTRFKIRSVAEEGGLLVYVGDKGRLVETDLADQMAATSAVDQLLAGQLSQHVDYALRRDGWKLRQAALSSRTRGLSGARVRLLPHQLYIAWRVAGREIPRVLLADEVGLGKTIEAGLIFCTLRALGRAGRVLVITPRPLLYQWLAELFRRFNDMFTILNEKRCEELDSDPLSPFQQTPRALCSLEFLVRHPQRLSEAVQAGWDLLIVDEAHHLTWQPEAPSPLYEAVERLAAASRGLLLLTATPLRSGYTTEFGLLRLVDPRRFASFDRFQEEMRHLRRLAALARDLSGGTFNADRVAAELAALFPADEGLQRLCQDLRDGAPPDPLLAALIDRHGTGRVLIRNRRSRLHGFPRRVLHAVPLNKPHDRIQWLADFLRDNPDDKVLLIAAKSDTVMELQDALRTLTTTPTAIFHEELSLVERDRQAAWFADPDGARVLLTSEIGGEGRNFQFAHHLVLWDLPVDPDILEQRIGRLDRIGQEHDVHIHAMYTVDGVSEAVFRWHQDGLNAFIQPVSGAEQVLMALSDELRTVRQAYKTRAADRAALLQTLIANARETRARVQQEVQANIDTLVDLNSFDAEAGARLVSDVAAVDADPTLAAYMSRLFERFGVVEEDLDNRGRLHVKPGDLMFVEVFPGLPADGLGATYDRSLALEREDLAFLSTDHPMVEGALGLMLDENLGRASVAACTDVDAKGILIQFLFVLEATGSETLELARYLPPTPIEINLDAQRMPAESLARKVATQEHRLARVGHEGFARYAGWLHEQFPPIVAAAEKRARAAAGERTRAAVEAAHASLAAEHERLQALREVNPTVSQVEVDSHRHKMERVLDALRSAEPRLDAIRLVALTGR